MSEVTADMIARGRGTDPRITAERRRRAEQVRVARDKLTSSGGGYKAFDLEFLKLYAVRRMAASPGMALLSLALAAVALRWATPPVLLVWLWVNSASLIAGHALSERFLGRNAAEVKVARWRRIIMSTEALQGCSWASLIAIVMRGADLRASVFALVALLLVGAMNVAMTASLRAAVLAALTPLTLTIVAMLRPATIDGDAALLVGLAVGTQIYFVYLARKLFKASLQALSFQAEKDVLITELEQSKVNSDLARRRAEESNLAKSRFLATMSHELRTPLNAILGFSEVMKAELFGRHAVLAYRDYANDIHSSGEHLLMLINEILDLSRVEAGRYDLREESVDLQSVIEDCRHLVALRAKKKDIVVRQAPTDVMPRLWADARALRQVVLNLLSNAIKFTPQGGRVSINVGSEPDGGQFFTISDTGAGIPEGEISIVMSSFGRGTLAQKNAEEGTGLGLPIVKGLVELHGGTFELKSKVREGTIVKVVFPPERVMSVLPRLEMVSGPEPAQVLPAVRSAA